MFNDLACNLSWDITTSEDPVEIFNRNNNNNNSGSCLADQFDLIVFLHTTGDDVLETTEQEECLMKFVNTTGKALLAIHAAADAEYNWDWYGNQLIGTWFSNHPPGTQTATLNVTLPSHPSMKHLVDVLVQRAGNGSLSIGNNTIAWRRNDEWYNFRSNPRMNRALRNLSVLITIDESSYTGGAMGADHPMVWCHEFDSSINSTNTCGSRGRGGGGGRIFYTALGHTDESYSDEAFRAHIVGAVEWLTNSTTEDTSDTDSSSVPTSNVDSSSEPVDYSSNNDEASDTPNDENSNVDQQDNSSAGTSVQSNFSLSIVLGIATMLFALLI